MAINGVQLSGLTRGVLYCLVFLFLLCIAFIAFLVMCLLCCCKICVLTGEIYEYSMSPPFCSDNFGILHKQYCIFLN